MPVAIGGHFLFREISHGSWLGVAAVIAILLLLRFWPQVVAWVEQRRRAR